MDKAEDAAEKGEEDEDSNWRAVVENSVTAAVKFQTAKISHEQVSEIIERCEEIIRVRASDVVRIGTVIPRTKSLEDDFRREEKLLVLKYSPGMDPQDFFRMKTIISRDQTIRKRHAEHEIAVFLSVLFESKSPDAECFDGVFVQDYNLPLLHLVNTEFPSQDGYTLFFELNRLRSLVSAQIDREIYALKFERASGAVKSEKDWERTLIFVFAGSVVVGFVAMIAFTGTLAMRNLK